MNSTRECLNNQALPYVFRILSNYKSDSTLQ